MNNEINNFGIPNNDINSNVQGSVTTPVEAINLFEQNSVVAAQMPVAPSAPVMETSVPVMEMPAEVVNTPIAPVTQHEKNVAVPVEPIMQTNEFVQPVMQNNMDQTMIINQADLAAGIGGMDQTMVMNQQDLSGANTVNPVPLDPSYSGDAVKNVANMIENPMYDPNVNFQKSSEVIEPTVAAPVEQVIDTSEKGGLLKVFIIGVILVGFVIALPYVAELI